MRTFKLGSFVLYSIYVVVTVLHQCEGSALTVASEQVTANRGGSVPDIDNLGGWGGETLGRPGLQCPRVGPATKSQAQVRSMSSPSNINHTRHHSFFRPSQTIVHLPRHPIQLQFVAAYYIFHPSSLVVSVDQSPQR